MSRVGKIIQEKEMATKPVIKKNEIPKKPKPNKKSWWKFWK